MEGLGGRTGFLKGFSVAAVLALVILCFLPVRYEANDDFALVSKLSGKTGLSADPLDPTLSTSLGWTLYLLYQYGPDLPWYGLYVCAACYLGFSLMLSVLFRSVKGLSLLLSLPFLGMVFFHLFSFVSFTSASLILESGVFLCCMEWMVRDRCPAKNPRFYAWVLLLAFTISYLLRWRLVLSSLVFVGPVLLFVKRRHMAKATPFLMALALFITGDRVLFHLTASDQHKAFVNYNRLRAEFHDTARGDDHGELTRKALKKVGWSLEDFAFYKSWVLYDNRKFNERTLSTFLKENDPQKELSLLAVGWKGLKEHCRRGKRYLLAMLFSIASVGFYRAGCLSGLTKRNRLKIIVALAYIGTGIALVVAIRSVMRVYVPLYAYFFGACFFFFHLTERASRQGGSRSVHRHLAVTCAVVFSVLAWGQAYAWGETEIERLHQSKSIREYILSRMEEVKKRTKDADAILILMEPSSGLGQETIHPLREFRDFTDLRILPAGWGINSPRYFSILRGMGLEDGRALMEWIVDNERALLVLMAKGGVDVWRWQTQWTSYFARNIVKKGKVKLVPVHDFRDARGRGLVLFSMRSTT